ncbi:asparaginase [Saccharicrinis sp. FJH62]|uniref:asparaginase n=1 Tax=Saccharicrinis sp. FJH62 TaxID=3344657 RepID=UPI0035D4845C
MVKTPTSILLIYTGGTIGMVQDPENGSLMPMDFENILVQLPELKRLDCCITALSFDPIIDSSNMTIDTWIKIAELIYKNYNAFDGFVILHGTDTMSFTASALSFMLDDLQKPVILTGAQLPLGMLRTDGKENIITAIEIASAKLNGKAIVPEVCIYFENNLFRGNRTTKHYSEKFNAFKSHHYPALAEIGVNINYNTQFIHQIDEPLPLKLSTTMDNRIALVKIFPGMKNFINSVLESKELKAVVIETYGTGNAPTHNWFLDSIESAIKRGILIVNVSQCPGGRVEMGKYETSLDMLNKGVLNGYDITTEAALTKLMYLLGRYDDLEEVKYWIPRSIRGELSMSC